ncbi:hypothetical protein LTR37_017038 [Vermiconidia calcicola]|uniref:Uncharacterized protein n=1 Tax=Vermiconidia calcicola TaxID=1690605 RepID=A0ACC3ML35_9PEZI|nr:hypothetical protein LTR37_017038 [Vermiconidia calcicola]
MAATLSTLPVTASSPCAGLPGPASERTVTVLLTTFAGLGLPRTLSLPVKASTSVHDVLQTISGRLPRIDHALIITTTANKQLLLSNNEAVSALLPHPTDSFLPLRLSVRLCGGKGGFGSQLRAAGGRMSSRKNRNQQNQNPNGSNRNLDGRRLRTVDTAKRLAEYLATKPDKEKNEKEEQKKRWQEVIENADKTEEAIRSGKRGGGQGRLDAEYVESKEQAEEKTREAVMKAMREGLLEMDRTGSESSMDIEEGASDDGAEEGSSGSSEEPAPKRANNSGPTFFGWDEDEEDYSEDGEGDDDTQAEPQASYAGKGKGKAA